jgi:hypothetical protein
MCWQSSSEDFAYLSSSCCLEDVWSQTRSELPPVQAGARHVAKPYEVAGTAQASWHDRPGSLNAKIVVEETVIGRCLLH